MRGRAVRSAALLAFAMLACVAAVALAHDFSARSTVTVGQHSANVAKGAVHSPRVSCIRNRRVEVRHARTRALYAFDRTDEEGLWRVDVEFTSDFYAKVHRRVFNRGGHRHVCRNDHSARIDVSGR